MHLGRNTRASQDGALQRALGRGYKERKSQARKPLSEIQYYRIEEKPEAPPRIATEVIGAAEVDCLLDLYTSQRILHRQHLRRR